MSIDSFFSQSGASKKNGKKKTSDLTFTLNNINVAKIDRDFNMEEMKKLGDNCDIIFETEGATSLEKLGISSLKKEPMITILPKEKTKFQTYTTMIDIMSKKELPTQTNIPCFGCRRKYKTQPIGIPIKYYPSVYISKKDDTRTKKLTLNDRIKIENIKDVPKNQSDSKNLDKKDNITFLDYFDTDGLVCSFNCMYLVMEENPSPLYKETTSLIPLLYKMIFGTYPKQKILKSPSWRLRQEYDGPLTDDEYEKCLQTIIFTDMHQIQKVQRLMNPVGKIFDVREIELDVKDK